MPRNLTRFGPAHIDRYTPFGRGLVTGRRGDSAEDAAGISLWSLDKISDDTEAVPVATFPGEHAFAWWAPAGKRGGEYRLVTWNSTASCLVVTPLTQEAGHAVGHTMHEWTLSSTPPKHDGNLGPGSPSTPSAGTRAPLSPQLTPSKLSEGARTLAQEFQELRRHGVEGVVTTRLDAAERVCEVQAVAEARARKPNFFVQLVVRLSMSFPAVYPNGAPPGIQVIGVEPATADRTEFKRRVKQELCEHAAAHVEDNQQCVRTSLVLLLKLVEAEAEALRDAKVYATPKSPTSWYSCPKLSACVLSSARRSDAPRFLPPQPRAHAPLTASLARVQEAAPREGGPHHSTPDRGGEAAAPDLRGVLLRGRPSGLLFQPAPSHP